MTMTKIYLFCLALLLLFSAPVYAQFPDFNAMTQAEIQAYVLQQQTPEPVTQPEPVLPTIITIQADKDLTDQLDMLQTETADIKSEFTKMQDRFNRLATDTTEAIDNGNKKVIEGVKVENQEQLNNAVDFITDYVDQKTNPVRQTAPAIGAFMILTAAFLLWASKQYKLCQGSQNLDKSSETDSVSKMTEGARKNGK